MFIVPIRMLLTATFLRSSLSLSSISRDRRVVNSILKMSSSSPVITPQPSSTPPKRIFCYGDSLTAGTSPPFDQSFPYCPHLERELNQGENKELVMVRWRGLPGWTASAMVEFMDDPNVGLRSALSGIRNPSLSLVIILAGTNDIGSLTSSMLGSSNNESDNVDACLAVEPILRLHKACLDSQDRDGTKSILTLAVGIPRSAWQERNTKAAKLCSEMNEALKNFAYSEDRVSYVDFPFGYERYGANWSVDGLHLSPEGYEALGKGLVPCVKEILDETTIAKLDT